MEDHRHPNKNSNAGAIIGVILLLVVVAGAAYLFLATNSSVSTAYSPTAPTVSSSTKDSSSQGIPPSGTYLKLSVTPHHQTDNTIEQAKVCARILNRNLSNHLAYPIAINANEDSIEVHIGSIDEKVIREVMDHLTSKDKLSIHVVHRETRQLAADVYSKEKIIPGFIAVPNVTDHPSSDEHPDTYVLIRRKSEVTGRDVKDAYLNPRDPSILNVELTDAGGKKMEAFTLMLTPNLDMIATVYDRHCI